MCLPDTNSNIAGWQRNKKVKKTSKERLQYQAGAKSSLAK
jgi:hypothetical protein